MKRREFMSLFPGAAAVWSIAARAQESNRVYRLAHLAPFEEGASSTVRWMLPELEKLGFVLGRNLIFDSRFGTANELPALAKALIAAKPDAIVVVGRDALRVIGETTRTIPIIASGQDVVGSGFAQSLAQPAGNVTGVVYLAAELDAKRLQLLHEAVPSARRIAALSGTASKATMASERNMRLVAATLNLDLRIFQAIGDSSYSGAFDAMRAIGAEALIISANPEFFRDAQKILSHANSARLPTICWWPDMAAAGCTVAYGPSRSELRRRLAHYAAQIFRGVPPGELPIEQPTRFELVLNMKSANALGLKIPDSMSLRADELIE